MLVLGVLVLSVFKTVVFNFVAIVVVGTSCSIGRVKFSAFSVLKLVKISVGECPRWK